MKKNHLIIMAGGIGSRFWPKSTPDCPKQFIDITGSGLTMIQQTVLRFKDIIPEENVWIVTSKKYHQLVKEQLPSVPSSQILLEPCSRNTAPCIAYVCWKIKKKISDANLIISPADHIVKDISNFRSVILQGLEFIGNADRILTLGIKASKPETGYGYIKCNTEKTVDNVFKIEAFKEKPDILQAQKYISEGNFFWNSGIFMWSVNTIEKAFRKHMPSMASIFDELDKYLHTEYEQSKIDDIFPLIQSISIDYAILEKAENVYCIPSDFGWSDVGAWSALHVLMNLDTEGNVVVGNEVNMIESHNCIVNLPEGKKVIIQGLDGYIIAEHNNMLLICKVEEEQRIKEFSSR